MLLFQCYSISKKQCNTIDHESLLVVYRSQISFSPRQNRIYPERKQIFQKTLIQMKGKILRFPLSILTWMENENLLSIFEVKVH